MSANYDAACPQDPDPGAGVKPVAADPVREAAQAVVDIVHGSSSFEDFARKVDALRAALAAPHPTTPPPPVEIDYTNHRGERAVRTIIPTGRLLPGDDTYHPSSWWVIEAWDVAKGALRTFDPAKIHRWGDQEPRSAVKLMRSVLAAAKTAVEEFGPTPPAPVGLGEIEGLHAVYSNGVMSYGSDSTMEHQDKDGAHEAGLRAIAEHYGRTKLDAASSRLSAHAEEDDERCPECGIPNQMLDAGFCGHPADGCRLTTSDRAAASEGGLSHDGA